METVFLVLSKKSLEEAMMQIFKKVARFPIAGFITRIGLIHTDTSTQTVADIQALVDVAKADHPGLTDEAIKVRIFSDTTLKGRMGIVFPVPKGEAVGLDYSEISEIPLSY